MRTTLDIADPILRDLKRLQAASGKSLGQLVSALLAEAMAAQRARTAPPRFRWRATAMGALVDIADKEALLRVLDQDT
jgi:hypothetical protein